MAKRNKSEPTKGDLLHQAYRNRCAMLRVHEAALMARWGTSSNVIRYTYWDIKHFAERLRMYEGR